MYVKIWAFYQACYSVSRNYETQVNFALSRRRRVGFHFLFRIRVMKHFKPQINFDLILHRVMVEALKILALFSVRNRNIWDPSEISNFQLLSELLAYFFCKKIFFLVCVSVQIFCHCQTFFHKSDLVLNSLCFQTSWAIR